MTGRKQSENQKQIVSDYYKKRWKNPEYRNKMLNFIHSSKFKEVQSESSKKLWKEKRDIMMKGLVKARKSKIRIINLRKATTSLKTRKKHSEGMKKAFEKNPELRGIVSENSLKRWANKKWKEEQIKRILKTKFSRPTKLERKFMDFFNQATLPYKYVGDGEFLIGYKNPDFININGEKICLEVGNKKQKTFYNQFHSWKKYEEERIKHFAKYGWRCVVLWEDDLLDNSIFKKLGVSKCDGDI
jgi:very-short-patch-repair endonuclease